jgi:DNA-binding GntR family transcriptional regulator
MPTTPSERVNQLLRRVESFERLGTLLALASEPDRAWTLEHVVERTRLSVDDAQEALDELTRAGLLMRLDGRGWQVPPDPELRATTVEVARLYQDDLVWIVQTMSENAIERVRSAAFRTFAEAFVVRRRDDD